MNVTVLQHIACEPPGVFEDVLRERSIEIVRVELDEGEPLPADPGAAVVVMGGPMGAYDIEAHPWLVEEKAFLAAAVADGVPVLGVCLGAQLLADATGGRAYPGGVAEVGVLPVHPTEATASDPVLSGLTWPLLTLQWHGDTFDLPPSAVGLAESPAYPNQAFRLGEACYGLQFHLEVTAEMADEWAQVPAYAASAEATLGAGGSDGLMAEVRANLDRMQADARLLAERWVDLWHRPGPGQPL